MNFAEIWNEIEKRLLIGGTVKNWTAAKGYLGDSFTIVQVSSSRVVISSPGATNVQSVPKHDFERVSAQWADYCSGSVQRQELRDITRFSKYIISILHHIGEQRGDA